MIESIRATNFQSLQDVNLEFGKFTVIVGPSSSGKSALTRAMKAVTSNALDSDNITKGTRHAAVSLKTNDVTVTIERESNGSSYYKVITASSKESTYTKLNRSVPAEVTEALGIAPSTQEVSSINFAGQFDTPYLLREGASSVARILGELTNVSTIFSAVREASKRAKNASTLANLRKKDLDKISAQIVEYASVGIQAKKISEAECLLDDALKLQARATLLRALVERASDATRALASIKQIQQVPEVGQLIEAQEKLNNFKSVLRSVVQQRQIVATHVDIILTQQSAIMQADDELHQTLADAGWCPTCNQEIKT